MGTYHTSPVGWLRGFTSTEESDVRQAGARVLAVGAVPWEIVLLWSGNWGRPPCCGYSFDRETKVLKDDQTHPTCVLWWGKIAWCIDGLFCYWLMKVEGLPGLPLHFHKQKARGFQGKAGGDGQGRDGGLPRCRAANGLKAAQKFGQDILESELVWSGTSLSCDFFIIRGSLVWSWIYSFLSSLRAVPRNWMSNSSWAWRSWGSCWALRPRQVHLIGDLRSWYNFPLLNEPRS